MKKYVLTIDQSTTSTKVFLINKKGQIVSENSKKHKQIYPQNGWVEHDPVEIYENLKFVVKELLEKEKINSKDIECLSITNQRETTVIWDKVTRKPVYNAIVWQCRRTKDICNRLSKYNDIIVEKTGLKLDSYFSGSKIRWILENCNLNSNRQYLFGNIDSWLIYNLTLGKVHATDGTNASRTLLFNIDTLKWDNQLLGIFGIKSDMLPIVLNSDDIFGYTDIDGILEEEIPITGVIGDSQGALFAQKCYKPGMVKVTIGTGSSVMVNVGEKSVKSEKGLVSALAWKLKDEVFYSSEAIINSSADTLNWIRNELKLYESDNELEKIWTEVKNSEGVYIVPAFVGLGIPHWVEDAKASICGLSRNSNRNSIIIAGMESIAYQINDAIEAMRNIDKIEIKEIKADGGAAKNKLLMQFISDITNTEILVNKESNLSAMGSFYIAMKAMNNNMKNICESSERYYPNMKFEDRSKYIHGWKAAVASVLAHRRFMEE